MSEKKTKSTSKRSPNWSHAETSVLIAIWGEELSLEDLKVRKSTVLSTGVEESQIKGSSLVTAIQVLQLACVSLSCCQTSEKS